MAISRRDLLLGTAAAASVVGPWVASATAAPRNLVVVVANGGWDLTFTFDPKPGVDGIDGPYVDLNPRNPLDVEEIGTWGDIDVTLNPARRSAVLDYFERWGHRTAVVRGVWVGSVSHWIGQRRILSGTDDPEAPDMATLLGSIRGQDRPLGAVDLSNIGRFGAFGRMAARGGVRGQLGQLLVPSTRYPQAEGQSRRSLRITGEERSAIDAWLFAEGASDRRVADAGRATALMDREEARRRAEALRQRADQLAIPAPGAQGAPGMARFAASLLATGTCASVIIDSGNTWDTHVDHVTQHSKHNAVFTGLDTLLGELDHAGVLDDTLVVCLSEMMRTPWRNHDGGTEHWPYTGVLLAGAGVAGGRVCGGTDDRLVGVPVDVASGAPRSSGALLRYDHLVAGILEHLGVEPGPAWDGVPRLRGFAR